MIALFVMFELLAVLPLFLLLLYHIIRYRQRRKLQSSATLITQREVHNNMEVYAFQNQGRSLDSRKIYSIPYANIGYSED